MRIEIQNGYLHPGHLETMNKMIGNNKNLRTHLLEFIAWKTIVQENAQKSYKVRRWRTQLNLT